jgi:glycosyltransferase involved in cell wall biosynthesis
VHPLLGEVIVVDSGSTDATSEIVRSFPSERLISHIKIAAKAARWRPGLQLPPIISSCSLTWTYRAIGIDFVSGNRVIRKELLSEALIKMGGLPRFGIAVKVRPTSPLRDFFSNALVQDRELPINRGDNSNA